MNVKIISIKSSILILFYLQDQFLILLFIHQMMFIFFLNAYLMIIPNLNIHNINGQVLKLGENNMQKNLTNENLL